MNPLELNKDLEIVPNEPTEVVSPEINETEELTAEIDVVDSEETALETKTDEQLQKLLQSFPITVYTPKQSSSMH